MVSSELFSFTEKILLNGKVLDFICPPNCEKNKINQVGNSIIKTLKESPKDLFANEIKMGYFHWITKPVKAVARVAVIGIVTLSVSPLGVAFNGVMAIGHIVHYNVATLDSSSELKELYKIGNYGAAFFTDLTSCISGIFFTGYLFIGVLLVSKAPGVMLIKGVAEAIIPLGVGTMFIGFGSYFLGAFYPSEFIARFLGDSDSRTGLYLALELRNKLGIVDQNGDLLKFCKEDEIKFQNSGTYNNSSYLFNGIAYDTMLSLIIQAELDLVDLVKDANHWLKGNGLTEIKFVYPFNGTTIAKSLEKIVLGKENKNNSQLGSSGANLNPNERIFKIIHNLKKMDYKINAFHEFVQTSKYIAIKGSIAMELLLSMIANLLRDNGAVTKTNDPR